MIKGFTLNGDLEEEPAHEDVALCREARELADRCDAVLVDIAESRERQARAFRESSKSRGLEF